MRKAYFTVILALVSYAQSFGQGGMFGAATGVGLCTANNAAITPTIDGYLLHKLFYRVYAGGELSIQRYSMFTDVKTGGTASYGDVISVSEKATYAFLSAKVDYAIGFRKYIHFSLGFGPGLHIGGHQYSNTHMPYWATPGGFAYGADTIAVNTSYNIPNLTFKGSFAISERIPTHGYWNIMLSQEFNLLPGNLSKDGPGFSTSYVAFKVGLMHKYPLVFVEY